MIGRLANEYPSIITGIRQRHPQFPMTIAGLETALFRASIASMSDYEIVWFGGVSDTLETDITIPFTDMRHFSKSGLKLGIYRIHII